MYGLVLALSLMNGVEQKESVVQKKAPVQKSTVVQKQTAHQKILFQRKFTPLRSLIKIRRNKCRSCK